MANVLLFEAAQNIDKINKCRYALLKYLEAYNLKPPADVAVVVHTDQPAFFESYIPFFHKFEIKGIVETQIKKEGGKDNFLNSNESKDSIQVPQLKDYDKLKEFGQLLFAFFKKNEEESIPNLIKLARHLDIDAIQKDKKEYDALPFYKKWLQTLSGKKWSIKKYEKKF